MALPISNIPILTGVAAESFVKNAKIAEENRGSVDISRQIAEWSGFDVRNAARIAKLRGRRQMAFLESNYSKHSRMVWMMASCCSGVILLSLGRHSPRAKMSAPRR
jgi:hypothetical protein